VKNYIDSEELYPMKPFRNGVLAVASNVRVDDDDGEKAGQRDQNHVHAEVRACASTQNDRRVGAICRRTEIASDSGASRGTPGDAKFVTEIFGGTK